MSSLRSKPLCIVTNFFVLWPICLSSSIVYSKKDLEYLAKRTAQVFISLVRLMLQSLVLRNFLVLLMDWFLCFYFHSCWFDGVHFHNSHFSFSPNVLMLSWFYSSIPFTASLFPLFLFFYVKFHSYILTVYSYCSYQSLQFFFFFTNTFISSIYMRWLIFSCDFVNL